MKKLLGATLVLLLASVGVAHAQQANTGVGVYDGAGVYTRMAGKQALVTGTVTNATYAWNFWSRAIQVCIHNQNITQGQLNRPSNLWFRLGTTLSNSTGAGAADSTGQTIVATSDALFRDGGPGVPGIGDAAAVITAAASDGTHCQVFPVRARGIIFNASVAASPDVTVFGGTTKAP